MNEFRLNLLLITVGLFLFGSAAAIDFEVLGVDAEIQANVLAFTEGLNADCTALLSPISRQHQEFVDKVKVAVQPFGFFNATVDVAGKSPEECATVVIDIQIGPPTLVTSSTIKVVGSDDPDFDTIIAQYKLAEGQILIQSEYQGLKKKLLELANEKLYLDAHFTEEKLLVEQAENSATIGLVFNTGPRYPISRIEVDIHKPILSASIMDRLITIKPHHFITQSELYGLKQKLVGYGYFKTVLIEIDEANKNDMGVPLNIKLTAAPKFDYSAGLGFSTDLGVKTSFKYNNHRINDRGHQLTSHLDISQVRNELGASYKIPSRAKPASKWFNVQLVYRDETVDNVDSQTSKLGFSQTRVKNNQWQNINFIDVLHETFDTGVDDGEALLLVPGTSWSLRVADDYGRPKFGYRLQTEIKGASEDILSDASFVQLTVGAKLIHSIGASNRMIYRAQAGGTASSDFDQIPTTYRFFAGGDQTIRGYDYESISPLNDFGDLAGGKHMVVGSVEFEHQFAPQWAFALFTDFGDSFNEKLDIKYSAGTGLRWFSPIGPIRLDLGIPLDNADNDFRIHVTIGPDL